MPVQIFADESEGSPLGVRNHFVMAGLLSHSENWAQFSDDWHVCLQCGPRRLEYFKMKEAAGCSGQFWGWEKPERDDKLRQLARIINKHVRLATWSVIDLEAHAKVWAKLPKPRSEPYFWPFQNTMIAACLFLHDIGWDEPFEAIFDINLIFGPRARRWYPIVQEIGKHREPEASKLLPIDPMFKNDRDFLPLQAADLYAWAIRKSTNEPDFKDFHWLLDEMSNVQTTDYSQYYDLDVESQQVVLRQTESADWDPISDAGVWSVPVVVVQPERQFGSSLS